MSVLFGETNAASVRLLNRAGFDVVAGSPGDFANWIRSEAQKWSQIVRISGAKVD